MHFNVIAPRYFEVLGTPFVLGRDFTNRDDATAPSVAIVNEAGRVVALGLAIGLPIAWMASRLVSAMLFGVTAHDPAASVASIAILVGAAFVAAFLPARRATKVDPLVAIRCE